MSVKEDREALKNARPGYHDPTAALGGPPAVSPLKLRMRLAMFGMAASLIGLFVFGVLLDITPIAIACGVAFAFVAVTALVDLAVIQRRRARGEPD